MLPVEPLTGNDVIIRDAVLSDALAIAELLSQLGHPVRGDVVQRHIRRAGTRDSDTAIVVAFQAGRVIGFITLHHMDMLPYPTPWLRITAMCVADGCRGIGIGRRLETAALERAQRLGCTWVEVTSSHYRKRAHHFYLDNGYEDTHRGFTKLTTTPFPREILHENRCGAESPSAERTVSS